jgi:hypothetical protein
MSGIITGAATRSGGGTSCGEMRAFERDKQHFHRVPNIIFLYFLLLHLLTLLDHDPD